MAKKEHFVYILRCSDGSFYVGMTSTLERRVEEHQAGTDPTAYTWRRRPVELLWAEAFANEHEAFVRERQIKGWSRAKKAALVKGAWDEVHAIVRAQRKRRERKGGRLDATQADE